MMHFPHAKINLGLSVVSRRADGFHEIETIFYPVPLHDVLEILPSGETTLTLSGLPVPGRREDNLLIRAWHLVKALRPALPPLKMFLHKAVPMGAGLGGGSSDAARLLLMMNAFFQLGLSSAELAEVASALGSDCVFFLQNGACIGTGRGEQLEPVDLDLSGYDILLVHPGVPVSTAWAYSQIVPAASPTAMKTLALAGAAHWRDRMINAFEAPVFLAHPELAEIKAALYQAGAIYAAMTGSGSTLFGIFRPGSCPPDAVDAGYSTQLLKASSGSPVW